MTGGALSQTCGLVTPVLWIRPGHAGYIGPDLGVDLHSTAVACFGVGLDRPFTFQAAGSNDVNARSVLVPARMPHRVVAPEGRILLLHVDPASADAVWLRDSMRKWLGPLGFDSQHEREFFTACSTGVAGVDNLLRNTRVLGAVSIDYRITKIARDIRDDPSSSLRAEQAAARMGLSTPHFLRVFASNTGTTFRRYQQWARLLRVGADLESGHDLTRCAADAGFASPSHLSETVRRTLGLSATALFEAGVQFDTAFDRPQPLRIS